MIKPNTAAAKHARTLKLGRPTPAIDLTGYTSVVINITGNIGGHVYKRGTEMLVDTPTLAALQAAGLIRT